MARGAGVLCKHTCVDHDQEFHEAIVDIAWRSGLDDEDVLVSYGLAYCDTGLLVGVVQAHGLCDLYAQPTPPLWISHNFSTTVKSFRQQPGVTNRFATSWASKGWEFPLSSLISFDMVDMVKELLMARPSSGMCTQTCRTGAAAQAS